jgi:hypothetical protein
MKRILKYIDEKNAAYGRHAMFDFLTDQNVPAEQRLVFAPYMAHFVFSFMDINRFVLRDLSSDDEYQHLVNIHTDEDSHHWPWYLNDLEKLQMNKSGKFSDWLYFIWSDHGIRSRMLTYDMVGLAKQASPVGKVILVEVIEKTGNVFLGHTADVSRQLNGHADDYLYYGKNHLDCESGHTMGTPDIENVLLGIELSEDEFTAGMRLIDDTYLLYEHFLDEMLEYANSHKLAEMIQGEVYPSSIAVNENP